MGGAMRRDLRRSVQRSMGRFLAILAIIALGAGFLVGLRVTKSAMMATAQAYVDEQALFDLRVMNTYGYTAADVEALGSVPGIGAAEGAVSLDVLLSREGSEDAMAIRLMRLSQKVNVPGLQAGRLPQRAGECLGDSNLFTREDIGSTLTLASGSEEDKLTVSEFTIVGLCSSPMYMNFERGSTTVGKGSLAGFLYVTDSVFDMDGVYTEVDLKLDQDYPMYDETYNRRLEDLTDALEPLGEELAQARYETVLADARQALEDGQKEYDEGLARFNREKEKSQKELADAKKELDDNWAEFHAKEAELDSGEAALESAQKLLDDGEKQLAQGRVQLQEQKAETYRQLAETEASLSEKRTQVSAGLRQLESGLSQIDFGLTQIDSGLDQIASGLKQLDLTLELARTGLSAAQRLLESTEAALLLDPENETLQASLAELEAKVADLTEQVAQLEAQREALVTQQAELQAQRAELETQRETLEAQKAEAAEGLAQIEDGLAQVESGRNQAEDQFTAAEAQLEASRLELENSQAELDGQAEQLSQGRAQLEEGRTQLEDAQAQYDQGAQEANRQLAEAQQELADARRQLEEGTQALQDMEPAEVYILDRNTNVSYACFESDASIVEGVGRVFPLFFFAVAALVCLTTMSKMIDEERTQIGVKKALGYSGFAISLKYLAYSGAASLAGCLIGVAFGTLVFPTVIWQGYRILYNFTDHIKLVFDAPLSLGIAVSFTLVMLLVTWLCCRKELGEVPAELIRPKSPKAGKRLLLERLRIWKHLSFLRKVSLRNIFRYKKRLVMMLVGVGGCTALVVTGLGIRDSISNIAQYQFEEVTVYDMAVTFGDNQSLDAQEAFRDATAGAVSEALFLHESTADATGGSQTKSVHFLALEEAPTGFINLKDGDADIPAPGAGEAVVNNGLAEVMNLQVGDRISLRTSDLEQLTLTVSGIFDNNVYNYVIISQDTAREQLGHAAKVNTAYLHVQEGQDPHEASALVSEQKGVLNVSVTQDMEARVENMMGSLDYIVALVVLCAAALAFVVIYNLTNINITERVREIATLKVLGFYPAESAAYVFREGMALTAMGCILGLVAGKLLHAYVISQIRVDMVFFTPRVSWISYVAAVLLTFLFAALVDVFLYFKLERINMAEALKSVE